MRAFDKSKLFFLAAIALMGPLDSFAGSAKCFMHGIITPVGDNKEKPSLSDMIRLHFDATEKSKCEQMMSAYCQYNVKDKSYSPARLKGVFSPDTDKNEEYNYTYTDKCKVQTDD